MVTEPPDPSRAMVVASHPTSPRTWWAETLGRWLWRPHSLHKGTVNYKLALATGTFHLPLQGLNYVTCCCSC